MPVLSLPACLSAGAAAWGTLSQGKSRRSRAGLGRAPVVAGATHKGGGEGEIKKSLIFNLRTLLMHIYMPTYEINIVIV